MGCLNDTGATFAPGRVHLGSLTWLYICLHDTTTKCHAGASRPGMSLPHVSTGARISLRYEISQRYHVNAKRSLVSVLNRFAGRLERVAHAYFCQSKMASLALKGWTWDDEKIDAFLLAVRNYKRQKLYRRYRMGF